MLILAAALRFYLLNGQSLWGDEGTSVVLSLRDLPAIVQGAALDIHPPLYYFVLHYWMLAFGSGEIAVQSLSVLTGVALVWVTYLAGSRLFGRKVALVAALLSASSPLQVQYSQETRMYAQAALLATLSVYLLIRLAQASGRRAALGWLAAWALATTGALYSHYFAATVILAENLAVGVWLLATILRPVAASGVKRSGTSRALSVAAVWATAQLLVMLAFLPWLSVMLGQWTNWPAVSQPFGAGDLLIGALSAFSVGLAVAPNEHVWTVAAFAAALALGSLPGLVALKRAPDLESPPDFPVGLAGFSLRVLTLLWLATPLAAMYLLSLRRPLYNPKFLLVATPAFYLLIAVGIRRLADALRAAWGLVTRETRRGTSASPLLVAALTLPFILATTGPLSAYYHDPSHFRDDYRGIAHTIAAAARSSDAIILNAPGQIDVFSYYYKGNLPVYPLPRQRPLDEKDTSARLEEIATGHGRVWTVLWGVAESDPQRFVESWLDGHAFKSTDRWFGNARLALYAIPAGDTGMQHNLNATFGEEAGIRLLGYSLAGEPAAGGDVLQLTLYWQATQAVNQRYKVFAHLLGPGDTLWGQRDSEPGGGLRPTTTWKPGDTIRDNYGLLILPGTPPGAYRIEVGMYRLDNGQRLPVTDAAGKPLADRLLLPAVTVSRPAVAYSAQSLGFSRQRELNFDGVTRLLGYDLIQPGSSDPPQVVLYWQCAQEGRDLSIGLQLVDAAGGVAWSQASRPVLGSYPTTSWQTSEIIRDPHPLVLRGLPKGSYRLLLSMNKGARALPVTDKGRQLPAGAVEIDSVVIP